MFQWLFAIISLQDLKSVALKQGVSETDFNDFVQYVVSFYGTFGSLYPYSWTLTLI